MGIFDDSRYEDSTIKYDTGELLLLFTDGITEATNSLLEEYGERRLRESLSGAGEEKCKGILERILSDLSAFRSEAGRRYNSYGGTLPCRPWEKSWNVN